MAEPIISVSGLRGIIGESLTPEIASRYAIAFSAVAPPGDILVSRDGRPSGQMLAEAIHAALHAVGQGTIDAGIQATPTVGVLIRAVGAAGGIQITASHNPSPYNGLKLFSTAGRVIPAGPGQTVLDRYRTAAPQWVSHDLLGERRDVGDATAAHLQAVLATVDVSTIYERRFNVVLDANHGAGGALGRRLLDELGCDVMVIGETADGRFEHLPEPTSENLAGVLSAVTASNADIGFCQDPDADRLAIIDETSRYIGEEYTLALCIKRALATRRGPIVTNCASSRMSADLARQHGVECRLSAVGEANVVDAMLECQAVYGGEGNGGPIDPQVGLVRDSFVGMAQVLDAMAQRQLPISRLADELPRYEIVKTKFDLPREKVAPAVAALKQKFADAQSNEQDGLRLDWADRWLLVRGSNTEPIVRAIAEAPTAAEAHALCAAAADVLRKV